VRPSLSARKTLPFGVLMPERVSTLMIPPEALPMLGVVVVGEDLEFLNRIQGNTHSLKAADVARIVHAVERELIRANPGNPVNESPNACAAGVSLSSRR
jgi:hypothetical protein